MDLRRSTLLAVLALAGCGGSSTSSQNCRTFATAYNDSSGGQTRCSTTGGSAGGALTLSCTTSYSFETLTTTTQYASVADFVAEAQLGVQRFNQQTATTAIQSVAVANATGESGVTNSIAVTFSGDKPAQSLQTRVTQLTGGGTSTSTFTTTWANWDGDNRPTRGTITGDGAGDLLISYDDVGRVITQVQTTSAGQVTVVITSFDTSGNETVITQGGSQTKLNIGSTARVCAP